LHNKNFITYKIKLFKIVLISAAITLSTNVNATLIDFEEFASTAMYNSPGSAIPTSARISNQYLA